MIERCVKPSFTVIGKEGSTAEGSGFVQKLWEDANAHFGEIECLAKRDESGNLCGVWGVMSDLSRSFKPWQNNFSEGLYLAGLECVDGAEAPNGWTKWEVPAFEYLVVESSGLDEFPEMISYLNQNNISLAGAVHDYTDVKSKKNYMYFPVKKL